MNRRRWWSNVHQDRLGDSLEHKSYWPFSWFPVWFENRRELSYLEGSDARRQALREVRRTLLSDRDRWLAYPVVYLPAMIGLLLLPELRNLFLRLGWVGRLIDFVLPFLVIGSAVLVHAWCARRLAQRHLRRYLLRKGVPICLRCGYDLRGQTEARCPECGGPFDPDLAGTQVSQRICEQPAATVDDLPGE